jgi:hypothetical protein
VCCTVYPKTYLRDFKISTCALHCLSYETETCVLHCLSLQCDWTFEFGKEFSNTTVFGEEFLVVVHQEGIKHKTFLFFSAQMRTNITLFAERRKHLSTNVEGRRARGHWF